MSFGMMQSFSAVISVDIKWPQEFYDIAKMFSIFNFNFDFFKPECSAKVAFWKTWLGFAMVPYMSMFPIWMSYSITRMATLVRDNERHKAIQEQMLLAAFLRATCVAVIIFVPGHLAKLLIPWDCVVIQKS
jgi:hypothetical protein